MKRLIFTLLAGSLLLLAGCNQKDAVTYSGTESGFIEQGIFTTDNDVKMTVVGNTQKHDVTTPRRVLLAYRTQPVTDADHIDIDVLGLLAAIILDPSSAASLPDTPDGESITLSEAWFGGGYLNLYATFKGKESAQHTCTATYKADEDGITIRFLHESTETLSPGATDGFNAFFSVPMDDAMLSWEHACQAVGKKVAYPVTVTLQWTDYVLDNGPLTLYEKKGSYTPAE